MEQNERVERTFMMASLDHCVIMSVLGSLTLMNAE